MRHCLYPVLAIAFLTAIVSPVRANDNPAPVAKAVAVQSWQGFYAGANVGYMIGAAQLADGSTDTGVNGAFGGAQFGYDWQTASLVYGLAADYDFSSASRDFVGYQDSHSYVASVHARLGQLITPELLVYGLGGVLFSDAKDVSGSASDTQNGWGYTVGAGIEKSIFNRTSIFAEYRYDRLNKVAFGGDFTGLSAICDGHELRLGVNYRF